MPDLLGASDVPGAPETPVSPRKLYEWDRVVLEATVRGGAHALSLRVLHKPPEGLDAAIGDLRAELPPTAEAQPGFPGPAFYAEGPGGHEYLLGVASAQTLLRLTCAPGLCPDKASADALAQRAADNAADPDNFVDPTAERSRPYVPRGHVKGRADRIWLPFSRFWLKVQ